MAKISGISHSLFAEHEIIKRFKQESSSLSITIRSCLTNDVNQTKTNDISHSLFAEHKIAMS